jgi:dihydrofolate reductase
VEQVQLADEKWPPCRVYNKVKPAWIETTGGRSVPLVTYVTDGIASAMAKAAAGDRNVSVQGAYTAQPALEAGVLDELVIHQIPVLFGGGRRLFEVLPARVELEIVRVMDTPEATHIHYRVRR